MSAPRAPLAFAAWLALASSAWAQPQLFNDRYEAGRQQVSQSQFAAAVTSFNGALAAAPQGKAPDPNIYVALGYAQMRLGRLDEAEASFKIAQGQSAGLTDTSRQELQANMEVLRLLRGH